MQCPSGKQTYPTRARAKQSGKTAKRMGLRRGKTNLRPYQCSICHLWHLTSCVNAPSIVSCAVYKRDS